MTTLLLVATLAVAVADWAAVHRDPHPGRFPLRWLTKPLTLALLLAAATSADLGDVKPWLLAALGFGLLGDVALLFADDAPGENSDGPDLAFLAGLGAFLVGHAFYLVAFLTAGTVRAWVIAGVVVVGVVAAVALPPVLRGAARAEGVAFAAIVAIYAGLLAVMSVLAVGTGLLLTAVGGVLFLVSDSVLARGRFVAPLRHGPLLVIVTYHLAQLLIVIGLVRAA